MRPPSPVPALAGGALLVAEAIVSPWMDAHWGYHALNVPLSVFVALAAWGFLRRQELSKLARAGAWITLVAGSVAVVGGLVPIALEPTGLGTAPGILEGIVHTFTLALFLGLGLFGVGSMRGPEGLRAAHALLGIVSLATVVLAVSGLSSPWVFLVPEALIGIGLAWIGLQAQRHPAPAPAAAQA